MCVSWWLPAEGEGVGRVRSLALTPSVCVDLDECLSVPGLCSRADCTNTVGSYVCTCRGSFVSSLDGAHCLGEMGQEPKRDTVVKVPLSHPKTISLVTDINDPCSLPSSICLPSIYALSDSGLGVLLTLFFYVL